MLIIKEWRCMSARFPRVLLAHPQWLFLNSIDYKVRFAKKNILRDETYSNLLLLHVSMS
jgi:hypothetical protein